MRAFFCIPIPDHLHGTIHKTAEHLNSHTKMRANWVSRQNYHLTLQFLGNIDPELTIELDDLSRDLCNGSAAFECILDRIGAFPSLDRARVIWLGGEAPRPLQRLSQAFSEGLVDLGFREAKKESLVHVTMARIKGSPDPALPGLIKGLNPLSPMRIPVDRILLMESTLTSQGPAYVPLFTTRFGRSEG
ncbi:RNA 2',3'-cyclic phosphodiesterase [Candidatus Bipolaricaulota bacterium]